MMETSLTEGVTAAADCGALSEPPKKTIQLFRLVSPVEIR
jgi:hypothetical protein